MWTWVTLPAAATGAVVLLPAALVLRGVRRARRAHAARRTDGRRTVRNVSVNVYVPIKGASGQTAAFVASLLGQRSRPDLFVFIVEDASDPAWEVVSALRARDPRVRCVVAGPATSCGQKNHNLLAGIAAYPEADVYVFCDAKIRPDPHWLGDLVGALVADETVDVVSTHHWAARRPGLASFFHTAILAYFTALACNPETGGVWGGATAFRRASFERLGVPALWSSRVVDDVVVQELAMRGEARHLFLPGLLVDGLVPRSNLLSETRWLARQIAYVRYYLPGTYRVIVAIHAALAVAYLAAAALPPLALIQPSLAPFAWAVSGPVFVHSLIFPVMRRVKGADDEPFLAWWLRLPVCVVWSGAVVVSTLFSRTIRWAGKEYRMASTGEVERVVHEPEREVARAW